MNQGATGNGEFRIGSEVIAPGEQRTIFLTMARMFTHDEINMPVHVIRGKKPGPRLFVSAALHGDEINGVEVIRRLIRTGKFGRLKGTLVLVPVLNVFAFLNEDRYSPDRRDLNRHFPGSANGSLTSRIAHLFMREIVDNCTHGIDLHAGSNHRFNFPQIRGNMNDPETLRLAEAFGAPVILNSDLVEGTLRDSATRQGCTMLLYEAGEARRFDEVSIRVGVRGIISTMRALDMLPRLKRPKVVSTHVAKKSLRVRAPISGLLHSSCDLGRRVRQGEAIGMISNPLGTEDVEVTARATGIVIGKTMNPLVNKGDALFHIGTFEDSKDVRGDLEEFVDEFMTEDRIDGSVY